MENKICIYAITKNEEKFVDKWYESMKEADAIVVLDTGSTDNTVEKLRSHGVFVETKIITPWRFDVARNESLKLVPDNCNILMSTDLDEVLEPGWADKIRNGWIEGVHERGVYKYSWSHLANGESGRVFRYDKIHSRNWIWRAPVHELLYNVNSNSNLYDYTSVLDLFDSVHLHHYPDMTKSRASYLPLLELRAKEYPDDYYGLIYLAHEYFYRAHYEKSIDTLNKVLNEYSDYCDSLEKASCYLFMGDSYSALYNNYKEETYKVNAIRSYESAINIDSTYIEPYLNLGKILLDIKDFESAEVIIKKGINNSYRHYTWLERDISWTYEPWDLLCLASYYSGNRRDSIIFAAKALSFEPDNERLKNNLTLCINSISSNEMIE